MAPLILNIEKGGVLRSLNLYVGTQFLYCKESLRSHARSIFDLPDAAPICFTYIDKEGRVVTLADDQDLKDALVSQGLNPLRLTVVGVNSRADYPVAKGQSRHSEEDSTARQPEDNLRKRRRRRASCPAEKDNVHRGIACDSCRMSPISGPRFKKGVYDLCLGCFGVKDEVEQAEYVEVNRRIYRLVQRVADVDSLFLAVSLKKSPGPVQREDDLRGRYSSGEPSAVIHTGVECGECAIPHIEGPVFKSCKKLNYNLCNLCFERGGGKGKDEEYYHYFSLTVRDDIPLTNKVIRLQRPQYSPAYICGRSICLVDCQTVVVDQYSARPSKEEWFPPKNPEHMGDWFLPERPGYLANRDFEEVSQHGSSEIFSMLLFHYPGSKRLRCG